MSNADEPTKSDKKFFMLEEWMCRFESQGEVGFDMSDLGLVPGVKIPPKFKVPDFVKYKGTSCPKTHVKSFYQKMSAYSNDEKLLMHLFQESLTGGPLEWYMQLESSRIRSGR